MTRFMAIVFFALLGCSGEQPFTRRLEPERTPVVEREVRTGPAPSSVVTGTHEWPDFPAFLWMYKGPELTLENLEIFRRYAIDAVNVEPGQDSSVVREARFYYYVGHAAGKGNLALRKGEYEDSLASGVENPIRPNCFNRRDVWERMRDKVLASYDDHAGPGVLGVSIDDEPSVTRYIAPADFCYGHDCMRLMRRWVRDKYVELRRLNDAWLTDFKAFEEIEPLSTTASLARNVEVPLTEVNFVSWSDHRRFCEATFASVIARTLKHTQQVWPGVPVGFLGGQPPSAFGGFEWDGLADGASFLEVYDIGGAGEVVRRMARRGTRFVETLHLEGATAEKLALALSQRLARLDAGVVLWSAQECFEGGDVERPTSQLLALSAILPVIRRAFAQIRDFGRMRSDVAIYESQASVRAQWLVDTIEEWETWSDRLSSYEADHSSSMKARVGWMSLLADLGIDYTFVSAKQVREGALVRKPPKVLILPRLLALSDREIRALHSYVRAGGCLIADSHLGLMDADLKGSKDLPMDRLLGVSRDTRDQYLPDLINRFPALSRYAIPIAERTVEREGPRSDEILIERIHEGGGETCYLNLDLRTYPSIRLDARVDGFRSFLLEILDRRGVLDGPHLDTSLSTLDAGLQIRRFDKGPDQVFSVCRRGEAETSSPSEAPWGRPISFAVRFGEPVSLQNVLTGDIYDVSARHDLVVPVNGCLFLRVLE